MYNIAAFLFGSPRSQISTQTQLFWPITFVLFVCLSGYRYANTRPTLFIPRPSGFITRISSYHSSSWHRVK